MTSPAVGYRREDTRKTLEEAGFDAAQARVLIDVMSGTEERLARKDDVSVLKTDLAVLKTDVAELKTDVGELKISLAALNGRMDGFAVALEGLRQEVRERIEGLRQEMLAHMDALEARLNGRIDTVHAELKGQLVAIKWLLGFVLATAVPAALALVRLTFSP